MKVADDATKLTVFDRVRRSSIMGGAGLAIGLSITDDISAWVAAAVNAMALLGIVGEVRSDSRADKAYAQGVVAGYTKASTEAGEPRG